MPGLRGRTPTAPVFVGMTDRSLRIPAVALAILLASCGPPEDDFAREPIARPVKLIAVGTRAAAEYRTYPAVIEASRSSALSFQVGGLIEDLPVAAPRRVELGAVIARLDERDFRSNLASAKAQFDAAEDEYSRAARLVETGAIARSAVAQLKSQRDVAKARLDSAEKALADTVLRAPFSGVIATVSAERLQNVNAGEPIATLIDRSELAASVDVPARVVAETPRTERPTAFVTLDAAPGRRFAATFEEASLVADAASQTYAVSFVFEPPEDVLVLPGMSATVELAAAPTDSEAPVVLPMASLFGDGERQYVWVVDEETMTVARREVTLEPGIGDTAIVASGLEAGETVVGAGASHLAEGAAVRRWTP